jgi:molybdopterin converting factor small subunit
LRLEHVNVTVRYHGIIGDMLRRKTQEVTMPDGATVTDLLALVTDGDEGARTILKQTRAFIDGKQADRAAPLADGSEVTFMRPIAGGAGFASGGGGGFTASGGVAFGSGGGACGSGGEGARRNPRSSSSPPSPPEFA